MAKYTNITSSGSATTLIPKGGTRSGFVATISVSNNSANPATIILDLFDGDETQYYICKNVVIPAGVVLVLSDNLSFDAKTYNLRIYNTGSSPDLTVIIK